MIGIDELGDGIQDCLSMSCSPSCHRALEREDQVFTEDGPSFARGGAYYPLFEGDSLAPECIL